MLVASLSVGGSVSAFSGGSATASGLVVQDLPDEVEELLADEEAGGSEAVNWDPFEERALGEVAESEGMDPLGPTELPEPGTPGTVEIAPVGDQGDVSAQASGES